MTKNIDSIYSIYTMQLNNNKAQGLWLRVRRTKMAMLSEWEESQRH